MSACRSRGLISRRIIAIEGRNGMARKWLSYAFVAVAACLPAQALDIRVTSGDWQPINLFIESFAGEGQLEGNYPSRIIERDLAVSGYFQPHRDGARVVDEERLSAVRQSGGEYLLTGKVQGRGGNNYLLQFSLFDALTEEVVGSYQLQFDTSNQRLAAHNVANWIYEKIVGRQGVFHTKVAYVLRQSDGTNELKVADYDGYNRFSVLSSKGNIISPTWSPDGNSLLYVSFERNKPIIYQQSLLTGDRKIVANYKGSNSAPAMSPDRRIVAAALTEHGGAQQIYMIFDDRKERLRESAGVNTEPVFSPTGEALAFVSDEAGSPQIYEYDLGKKTSRRLTYGSRYNVSPDYSAGGDVIVFIRRDKSGDNVALLDVKGGGEAVRLTDVRFADSPSFAPNDDIVMFRSDGRKRYLATVSVRGKIATFWDRPEKGRVIDPSWSPAKSDWF